MKPIFAKKIILIQKNGYRIDYTHVTRFEVVDKILYITGEGLDLFKMPENIYDKIPTKDIQIVIIDFHEPKE